MLYSVKPVLAIALIPERSSLSFLCYGLYTFVLDYTQSRLPCHLRGLGAGGKVFPLEASSSEIHSV